jgi:transposase
MKRDGRTLDHKTPEEFRLLTVRQIREGGRPSAVVRSLGLNRTSLYRWLRVKAQSGEGELALLSRPVTGRLPKLTPGQQTQVLEWIDGKDPRHYGLGVTLWTRQIVSLSLSAI